MTIKQVRKRLNDRTREIGNKILGSKNFGLGDVLTTNINFRRVGTVAGAVAPLVGLSAAFSAIPDLNYIQGTIIGTTVYLLSFKNSLGFSTLCADRGYFYGEKLDTLVGENTPRFLDCEREKISNIYDRASPNNKARLREGMARLIEEGQNQ